MPMGSTNSKCQNVPVGKKEVGLRMATFKHCQVTQVVTRELIMQLPGRRDVTQTVQTTTIVFPNEAQSHAVVVSGQVYPVCGG